MRRTTALVVATGLALALSACTSSSKTGADRTGGTASNSTSTTATASQSVAASAGVVSPSPTAATTSAAPPPPTSGSVSVAGAPTSLDPCKLVPAAEASSVAGVTFGPGQGSTAGVSKRCVYGAQTLNVFTVEVEQAADASTAQVAFTQAQAQAQAEVQQQLPPGINANFSTADVAGLADKAVTASGTATIGGQTLGISGIYVLKGATFFAFQDFRRGSPPTAAAMEAEAQMVLGRI